MFNNIINSSSLDSFTTFNQTSSKTRTRRGDNKNEGGGLEIEAEAAVASRYPTKIASYHNVLESSDRENKVNYEQMYNELMSLESRPTSSSMRIKNTSRYASSDNSIISFNTHGEEMNRLMACNLSSSPTKSHTYENDNMYNEMSKRGNLDVCINDRYFSNCIIKQRIAINVGGVRFETYKSTLRLIGESRLANLTPTNSDYDPVKREYFFDRDPASFQAILNYFRTGKLHAPNSICGNLLYDELTYWGIDERCIQPCCWTKYSNNRQYDEILKKVLDEFDENDVNFEEEESTSGENDSQSSQNNDKSLSKTNFKNTLEHGSKVKKRIKNLFHRYRPQVWQFLDDRKSSRGATIYFWISVVFLVVSIFNFVLETSPLCRVPFEVSTNKSLTRRERDLRTTPHPILTITELVCNIFFTLELFIRFLSSPDKIKFMRNPYHLLEFLAISPLFFPPEAAWVKNRNKSFGIKVHNIIEVFYILRVLRIFTLVPKHSGLRVLLITLKNSIGELMLYLVMLFMTILLFASFIFYAEQIFEQDDNKFDSILIGLWWAIVTMTTLGYGDYVPSTTIGYLVGGMCAITGLIFTALPIPVIVNNFTQFYAHAKARQKLKENTKKQKHLPHKAVALRFDPQEVRAPLLIDEERRVFETLQPAVSLNSIGLSQLSLNLEDFKRTPRVVNIVSGSIATEEESGTGLTNSKLRRNESFKMNAHAAVAFGSRFSRLQLTSMSKKKLQAHLTNDAITVYRWKICRRKRTRRLGLSSVQMNL